MSYNAEFRQLLVDMGLDPIMPRTVRRPPLVFPMENHTRLMQGMTMGSVFLFRVWRVNVLIVPAADLETAGLNPHTNPLVYYVARDAWSNQGMTDTERHIAGPLTLDGAAAIARTLVEEYNRNTNFGAF